LPQTEAETPPVEKAQKTPTRKSARSLPQTEAETPPVEKAKKKTPAKKGQTPTDKEESTAKEVKNNTPDPKTKRKREREEETPKTPARCSIERSSKKQKTEQEGNNKSKVVISFSSFKDGTSFNLALKDSLTEKAESLNAKIQTDAQFEPGITHVVRAHSILLMPRRSALPPVRQ
jgi:hypothetical protein